MPKLLRPRQEFPTPLFRAFAGALAGGLGGLPIWMLAPRWENPRPALAIAAFVALVVALLVATSGRTARGLAIAFAVGTVGMLAAIVVVVLASFAFGRFE